MHLRNAAHLDFYAPPGILTAVEVWNGTALDLVPNLFKNKGLIVRRKKLRMVMPLAS